MALTFVATYYATSYAFNTRIFSIFSIFGRTVFIFYFMVYPDCKVSNQQINSMIIIIQEEYCPHKNDNRFINFRQATAKGGADYAKYEYPLSSF